MQSAHDVRFNPQPVAGLPLPLKEPFQSRIGIAFVLDWFPNAGMSDVVIIALTAERISAAFHATVGTDRRSTVTALRHGSLGARHTYVVVTGYVLDLAELVHGKVVEYQYSTMQSSQPTFG